MKPFLFFYFVVFAFNAVISQTVYEKVLIPIYQIYQHTETEELCTKDSDNYKTLQDNLKKATKNFSCKEYLIASAWSYNQDEDFCIGGTKDLFQKAVKDSLRWVKIVIEQTGNISLTLTTRSSPVVKMVQPFYQDQHIFCTTVLPQCDKDKNLFSKNDTNAYLELTIKANKNETQHLLFKTFKEAIYFVGIDENTHNPCKFFGNPLMSEAEAEKIYKKMAENVQFIGKAMKEQKDSQNQIIETECKYKGKMLFDAMQATTVDDIKRFLSYCVLRPDTYRRELWSIAEVYATWLVAGMPLPNK